MNKKYLYLPILAIGMIACGESQEVSDEIVENVIEAVDSTVTETIVEVLEVKIDFSKFEHYATIQSKEELISTFGKENTRDKVSWYAEGTTKKESTVLTNPDNGHIVKFVWDDENDFKTDWIEANHYKWGDDYENMGSQVIETEDGLRLGMPLAELVTWNGADFEFSGFGWDFAGSVMADEDSRIKKSAVIIRLMDEQIDSDFDEWSFMQGDQTLRTDDDKIKDAPVLIEQFTLFIEEDTE